MKKKKKIILISIVGTMAALLCITQVVLLLVLPGLVRKALLESSTAPFEQTTLESIRFNLFTGRLTAKTLSVPNPAGFETYPAMFQAPSVTARIAWPDLLRGIVNIRSLEIPVIRVTIARNKAGGWNLPWLPQPDRPAAAPTDAAPQVPQQSQIPDSPDRPKAPQAPAAESAEDIELSPMRSKRELHIAHADINLEVIYADQMETNPEPPLILRANISANDIFTYGYLPEPMWGKVTVQGNAMQEPDTFVIDLEAHIAPLLEPEKASFKMRGGIKNMDMHQIKPWYTATGLTSDALSLDTRIHVQQGDFRKTSHLKLTAVNAQLSDALSQKLQNVKLPRIVELQAPISGTLQKPSINLAQAITQSLLQTLAKNPEAVLDQISIDGKSLRERLGF